MEDYSLRVLEKDLRIVGAWDEFVLEVIDQHGSLKEYEKYGIVFRILSAFVWNKSTKGHAYWNDVYKKISKLNK